MSKISQPTLDTTFLTQKESFALKGIFIIFIIIGHNIFLSLMTEKIQFQSYLYCFHIQCFFLLPFLYPLQGLTIERLVNHFIRNYIPLLFFTSIGLILNLAIHTHAITWKDSWKLLFGNSIAFQNITGFQILWFLPSFCIFSIIKEFVSLSIRFYCILMLIILLIIWIAKNCLNITFSNSILIILNPFIESFKYILMGMLLRLLVIKIKYSVLHPITFIFCSILYFINYYYIIIPKYHWHYCNLIESSLRCVMPILFFLIVYHYRSIISSYKVLYYLGKNSLIVYLVHQLPIFALYFIYNKYMIGLFPMFCLSIIGSILFLYFSILFFDKYPIVKEFIFPKSLRDWRHTLLRLNE